jgi:hypothetical protein
MNGQEGPKTVATLLCSVSALTSLPIAVCAFQSGLIRSQEPVAAPLRGAFSLPIVDDAADYLALDAKP